jgi:DNA-binding CsgD family transcriptional regulator
MEQILGQTPPHILPYCESSLPAPSNFLAVLELLPCVTWIVSRDCGCFDFISRNISEHLGLTHQEYIRKGYIFHETNIHKDDFYRVHSGTRNFWKLLDESVGKQLLDAVKTSDYRIISAAGETLSIREQTSVFCRDSIGSPTHLISCLFKKPVSFEKDFDDKLDWSVELVSSPQRSLRKSTGIPIIKFTKRETEILKLLREGKSSRYISDMLSISFHTVNTHRQKMIEKSGSCNTGEVINYALKNGII